MDTLSEKGKVKHSAIFRQTIVFTAVSMAIVLAIVVVIRVIFIEFTIRSYNELYVSELNIGTMNRERSGPPQDSLSLLYQLMQDSSVLRRSLLSNKIVILDGVLISDPYGLIKEGFKIPRLPYLYEYDGLYYIFIGVPIFESSFLIVGNPSLELTALLKSFEKIVMAILSIGAIISLIISYFLAKNTLKPVVKISEQISKIDADNINERIPEQASEEFDVLAKKLNSMLDRIEYAFEIQNQFVSDVSHELRTPLTSINGYIKMLKRWGKSDPQVMNEALDSIESSSEYLRDLVEKLLLLTKSEYKIEKEVFDISEVLADIFDFFKLDLKDFSVKVNGESFKVETSKEYLFIILKVLFENAIKYSSDKKEIEITLDPSQKKISIKDYGIGIEKEKLKNIFERFYKADPSRSQKGHGLGLSIAKKLADTLHIKISVESEMGKGSIFTLSF
ncbi:cell wall metabolism sensor histidine kinase WalK [Petrotoga sp. 9PWA.NaAc.5.4]|uniref:sensor histidine kinase n=1 Tax=Petrotoga sp. 9PWA.NaAc.5.4 TaxID=1434328 RepID=UPI000EFD839E|nr:HAMP domain-containing sensor histidine kinase [Petrotoga sp. 9PWA.NaAc.5.4]